MINFENLFGGVYKDKNVVVTGHTGFKGSWLVLWLLKMKANVIGYSKGIPTNPNHFDLLKENGYLEGLVDIRGDVRDSKKLEDVFKEYRPDIVFHLAAQSLVRYSYESPIETYETNVIGTLKVFEVCRKNKVKAIVNITSDKCYDNKEWLWGYRENDPMGGYDPYSSSKGCAEILTASYRNSYFNLNEYGETHDTLLASCRAGNVIGGGDWAKDRLISDIMIAADRGEKVKIRNPKATRPWQYVLEPLSGYLMIGQKLLEKEKSFADAWNFGPNDEGNITVEKVVKHISQYWEKIGYELIAGTKNFHEAGLLRLDCSKAHIKLKWTNILDNQKMFKFTTDWYRYFYEDKDILTISNLNDYIFNAMSKGVEWAKV